MAAPRRELRILLQHHPAMGPPIQANNGRWAILRARARARAHVLRAWARILVISSITVLVAFLGISDFVGRDGGMFPSVIFHQHPESFYMLVAMLMIAFYSAVIGLILSHAIPELAEFFYLLASGCLILAFTLLVWVFLPNYLSWTLWYFYGVTTFGCLGAVVYEVFLR